MNRLLLAISVLFALLTIYMIYTLPDSHSDAVAHSWQNVRSTDGNELLQDDDESEKQRLNLGHSHADLLGHHHPDIKKGGGISACPYFKGNVLR